MKLPGPVHWLIYTAGVLVAICAIIIGLASTAWFRNILQQRIETGLAEVTGGKVEITGMRFHPLELRISARQVIIRGREKIAGQPLFSAQDVVVNVSPESLLQLRLQLRSLQWQRAELHVQTYPDGSTNVPGATVIPSQGQGLKDLLDLGIERLTLSNTTLQWNDRRIPFQAAARDVAIQLNIGKDHQYEGTIASSAARFDWKNRTLPQFSFAAAYRLSDDQIQISSLSWQIENFSGNLAGRLRWTPDLDGSFQFRANGGLQDLSRAMKIRQVERGFLYVDGTGTYDAKGFAIKGRMRARDLRLKASEVKPGAVNFSTDYSFSGDTLKLPNFSFAGLKARANGDATVLLAKARPRVILHSRFKELDLSVLMQLIPALQNTIGIFRPKAILSGTLDANWQQPARLQSQFDLQFHPPQQSASEGLLLTGHARGSLDMDNQVLLTLNDAQLSTPHSTISSQGTFGTTRSSMNIQFATSDFEEWRPAAKVLIETRSPIPIKLHSQATFTGRVAGTFSNPGVEGQISAGTFNYGGWLWDSFDAGILISPDRARVQSGLLKLGKSSLKLNAEASLLHWKLEPDSAVRLQATAQETPVAGLRAALNLKTSMQGLISGHAQAEGTVKSLSGRGQISVHKGEFAGVPFDSLSANIVATRSNLEISDFNLTEGRGNANGQMQINPVERTFSANLHGRNFPLDQIHFLKSQQGGETNHPEVSGLVSFNLRGEGSVDNARLSSTLDVTNLAWKGQSLGSLRGDAEWQGQQVRLQIKGSGGKAGNFQMSGSMETAGNWPLHMAGQYSDFRADPWIEEFSGHDVVAEISATGSFTVEGPLKDKSKLSGSSRIEKLKINFPAVQLSNEGPVEVDYADSNLRLKRFRLEGQSTNFEVGGSIHFSHPSTIDISARGEVAATLLSLAASGVQATGQSNLEVRLSGSLKEPQLSGEVQIKDVGLGYTGLPFRLNALNGTVKLDGERASISSMKGTIGGGAVNISGFVILQETPRYQIRTELSQVRVRYPSDFTSVLDGRLTLAGTPEQGQLTGNISVRNLFANENLNLVDLLSGPNPLGGPSAPNSSSIASHINLNVSLASVRPVRIESRDLRVVTDIDLQLQGTLANPVAVGNIYLRSGDAIFRGNRYTLTRGDISMTNPFRTEPVLDLQVHTTIDKYDLTLEISGPQDQVRLSYRSDPPLPTQDILSLLAFGYSKRLEEFAPESKNPFSSAGASALLSQALSSQVTGRIQRLFGVSRIKYSPTSAELGTLGGPVLTVEQQLSPDLTLTYETSTANSQYRVVEFEYTVNPRMAIRGFRDQNGIFGLELKFLKRFK